MCGLVGVIGNLFEKDKRAFETMLKLDTIRGPHSTGIARVTEAGVIEVVKDVGTPWDLIESNPYDFYNTLQPKNSMNGNFKVLMGHNRWATIGAITAENAHPFQAENIVGAHNGTLYDSSRKKLFKNEVVGTDSQAIMENLNYNGVVDTFSKLEGAWALTWYNKEEDTFNVVRNKERTLFFSYNKKGDVLYYASEPWIIFAAAERCGIELENPDVVYTSQENTHYKWKVGPSYKFGFERLEKVERKGYVYVAPKKPEVASTYRPFSVVSSNPSSLVKPPKVSAQELAQFWGPKKGQFVEFKLGIGWKKDEQQKPYLQCFSVLKETEIRIYPTLDDILPKLGSADADTFTAKIKKVKFKPSKGGTVYITIDTSTLEIANGEQVEEINDEIPWDNLLTEREEEEKEDTIVDQYGHSISAKHFMALTNKGCCWCNYEPLPCDSHDLQWISGTSEFLCEDCKDNEYVKQYITNYTN